MFGYVRVRKPELKIKEYDCYRCYYCGLCRSLKKYYGIRSELLLSYDLTFLTILLSSVYGLKEKCFTSRCITHPFRKKPRIVTEADSYTSAMSLVLGYYHFEDDRADSGKKISAFLSLIFKRKAKKAADSYPRQTAVLNKELAELHELEKTKSTDIDALCDRFGKALGEIFVWKEDGFSDYFREMGYHLGCFIYLMDAVDDWKKDRKNREFNPFSEIDDQRKIIDMTRNRLLSEMTKASAAFEMLPAVDNEGILKNIIYAGVWNRFDEITEQLKQEEKENGSI